MSRRVSAWQWVLGVLVVVAIGGYLALSTNRESPPTPISVTPPAPAPKVATTPHYPIPVATPESGNEANEVPPAPDTSDADVMAALTGLPGADALRDLLAPDHLIARIVALIDALPRPDLPNNILPVRAPGGRFATSDGAGVEVISEANYTRYAPYMRIVESVDPKALVDWYVRYYPQFQAAYRQLGYPKGYFNDHLVAVIDNLLATPEPIGVIELTQRNVLYEYANPALQSLSSGQKMLLRVGSANAAVIKSKLRVIRADLVAAAPTGGAAATTPATTATDHDDVE